MTFRGGALDVNTSVENQGASSLSVSLADGHVNLQSDTSRSSTATQHLKPLDIVDELANKPVCEESVCFGDSRHVDVFSPANFAQDQFKLLDKDGNGFIKDDEIKAYQERFKENMTPRMKENLDSLLANYQSTMQLANDEWGYENDGMTMRDLDVLEDREDGAAASEHIKEFAAKHFDETDTDKNGYITAREIKAYEQANQFRMEHPVRDREALNVIGNLSEDRNYARATGDYLGMTDYTNSGRGLTRAQVLQAAELVKNGVEGFTNPFFFFDKKED
jgi:hypothetical protein